MAGDLSAEMAYRWLHGDRVEYSGCRAAAEALEAEIQALRKDAERYRALRAMLANDADRAAFDGAADACMKPAAVGAA